MGRAPLWSERSCWPTPVGLAAGAPGASVVRRRARRLGSRSGAGATPLPQLFLGSAWPAGRRWGRAPDRLCPQVDHRLYDAATQGERLKRLNDAPPPHPPSPAGCLDLVTMAHWRRRVLTQSRGGRLPIRRSGPRLPQAWHFPGMLPGPGPLGAPCDPCERAIPISPGSWACGRLAISAAFRGMKGRRSPESVFPPKKPR